MQLTNKQYLLVKLQAAMALHLKAEVSESAVERKSALDLYRLTAQLAGLSPLHQHTLDVLEQRTTDPHQVTAELRALYIGILRVAHRDATLEWQSTEQALCVQLRKTLQNLRINNCIDYVFRPLEWHKILRTRLSQAPDTLLPLILLAERGESQKLLRRVLRTDNGLSPKLAYLRLCDGQLSIDSAHHLRLSQP